MYTFPKYFSKKAVVIDDEYLLQGDSFRVANYFCKSFGCPAGKKLQTFPAALEKKGRPLCWERLRMT